MAKKELDDLTKIKLLEKFGIDELAKCNEAVKNGSTTKEIIEQGAFYNETKEEFAKRVFGIKRKK